MELKDRQLVIQVRMLVCVLCSFVNHLPQHPAISNSLYLYLGLKKFAHVDYFFELRVELVNFSIFVSSSLLH